MNPTLAQGFLNDLGPVQILVCVVVVLAVIALISILPKGPGGPR